MEKYFVLCNPNAGCGKGFERAQSLKDIVKDAEFEFVDMTKVDYSSFIPTLSAESNLVIAGGDGTLNRFVNEVDVHTLPCKILYFAAGSGNDFLRDVDNGTQPLDITAYLQNLPTVTVNGKTYKFINGVGYGIDGYCCEVGDKEREAGKDNVNYAGIAIKGMLFHFKPRNATVIVDGKEYFFKNAWLAPAMFGRFYGGGMLPAPKQSRIDNHGQLSVMLFHGSGKLKTLTIFPGIFKGAHVNHTDCVTVLEGHEIKVKFETPCALQIDGETILNVSEYSATGIIE